MIVRVSLEPFIAGREASFAGGPAFCALNVG